MIVCVCYGVSDRKIQPLIEQGLATRTVLQQLNIGDCCGKCVPIIKDLAKEQRAQVTRYLPAFATP